MTVLRWFYNRIGQMFCFSIGALSMGFAGENESLPSAIAGLGFLLAGVGLKAIFHWRQSEDPDLV